MLTSFKNNPRHFKAALLLALMSQDMVEDIINLVGARGRSLLSDLADPAGPPKPLAVLSRAYIADDTIAPSVLYGVATILTAALREPTKHDTYEALLMNAYDLPQSEAAKYAANIETEDRVTDSPEDKWYSRLAANVGEDVRKLANWGLRRLDLGLEVDQNQKYDLDYLFELSLLGDAVMKLQRRSALIAGNRRIVRDLGLFARKMGDADQTGEVLDVFAPHTRNHLPVNCYGGLTPVVLQNRDMNMQRLQQVARRTLNGTSQYGDVTGDLAATTLKALLTGGGLPGIVLNLLMGKKNDTSSKGDIDYGDAASEIAELYGDSVARCYEVGDIPGMYRALDELTAPATTGDSELDEAIIGDVLNDIAEEHGVESLDPEEVGGLFTRWRVNAAIRKGNRRRRNVQRQKALTRARNYGNYFQTPTNEEAADDQNAEPSDEGAAEGYDLDSFNP